MGSITSKANVSNCTSLEDLKNYVSQSLQDIQNQVNGNITFSDNIDNNIIDVSIKSGTTNKIEHGLGRVPLIWISGNLSAGKVIFQTQTPDANLLYLDATGNCNAKILVI